MLDVGAKRLFCCLMSGPRGCFVARCRGQEAVLLLDVGAERLFCYA
jgi:hypothetical protein